MHYKGIALFCDLHRVLLNEQDQAAPEDKEALERFIAGGGKFGVIADYSPATVLPMLHKIPTNTWSVVLGGAEAYRFDTLNVAFPRVISQLSMAAFLRQVIGSLPDVSILLYSESRLFCLTDPELINHRFRHGQPPYDTVGLETALRFPWLGVRFFGPEPSLDILEAAASRLGIYDLAECIHDEPGSFYFAPHGASKSRCMGDLRCLEELRDKKIVIAAARTADRAVMAQADVTVAAAKSAPSIRAAARHQVPETEPHSLRYIIDEILPVL